MKKSIITLLIMAFSAIQSIAQIDLHSHAITKDYMDYIKANGAEMDEGFPLPSWDVEQHIAFMDKAGIQTAHFKKYKEGTAKMVKSLKLIDVNPLAGTGNIVK